MLSTIPDLNLDVFNQMDDDNDDPLDSNRIL